MRMKHVMDDGKPSRFNLRMIVPALKESTLSPILRKEKGCGYLTLIRTGAVMKGRVSSIHAQRIGFSLFNEKIIMPKHEA